MPGPIKLSAPVTREFWEIPVLFEDEHLLALDKPPLLLCSPAALDPSRPDLTTLLRAGIAEAKPWAKERGLSYLSLAHRLDDEASGVLLLAKSKPVHIALTNLFGSEKPVRTYSVLVMGNPSTERLDINAALAQDERQPGLFRVEPHHGKRSRTLVETVETFAGLTLLRCQPLTDRTHQLRVHLRYHQMPVLGDRLYPSLPLLLSRLKRGYRLREGLEEKPLLDRAALHAERMTLEHPVTGTPVEIASPLPKDFLVALKYLRRYAPEGARPVKLRGPSYDQ